MITSTIRRVGIIFTFLLAFGCITQAAEPERNLLVISSQSNHVELIDAAYAEELRAAGYNLHVLSHEDPLSLEYLNQFGAVIVANLPNAGAEYTVPGYRNRYVDGNLALLHTYVAAGGGLLVYPAISQFGEAYAKTYDGFLKPWGAQLLIHQLKDGSSRKNEDGAGAYGKGTIHGRHEITKKLGNKPVLYPLHVLRWDHAYSCTPIITNKDWTPLARADNGQTHVALTNNEVGEALTKESTLFAVRKADKGMVAVSAIHSYYTLTMVSLKESAVGENDTGVIDHIVMQGEKNGRPSNYGKLIDATLQAFMANSAKNKLGSWADIAAPAREPYPTSDPVIDWTVQQPPPTWAHRVIPSDGWPKTYDELPDPTVFGPMKHWKMLVGPRTRYSSGEGTVAEYKAAAIEAGYSAITFTETFEDLTPKMWEFLLKDCEDNTDENFVCLPGLDIESTEGQRYLVLGADRYPSPNWLTPDGKKLAAIRMLSLGWFGHVSVVHRPGKSALHSKMYKHYTGISVATYDTTGKQIDDGMYAYRWALSTDSGAFPIAVHEVMRPGDVAKATKGFQQILPSPSLAAGVKYFRFAFSHNFDSPPRYYISEGPILDGWSMFNKDRGKAEEKRWRWRAAVGVSAGANELPITSVRLYDGFRVYRNWRPNSQDFDTIVDGGHSMQHNFSLVAADSKGNRVIAPMMRTVTRNWRLRCGDKQNWLGTQLIYTGWWLNGLPGYKLSVDGTNEGNADTAPPVLDFPFFSDHLQVNDADMGYHFYNGTRKDIAGDAKGMLPVRANDVVDGKLRYSVFTDLKQKDFAVMIVDATVSLKSGAMLEGGGLNPIIGNHATLRWNNSLILPNGEVEQLGTIIDHKTKRKATGDADNMSMELPVGSYAGGIVPLTPGLRLNGRQLGFATAPGYYPAGTTWKVQYLMLRDKKFFWKTNRMRGYSSEVIDDKAEQALTEMGFRGELPYTLDLTQGKLEKTAYIAHLTAENGGVSGTNRNSSGKSMIMHVPLAIRGLDTDSEMVLWRSDSPYLEPFAAFEGQAFLTFNADKNVDFYAGNAALCDPALAVSIIIWDADTAHFRVHNPTNKEITSAFTTAAGIKGFKALKRSITVPAGSSIEIK